MDVSYKENQNSNASDQWTYFFNAKTFLIVAAKVFHSPTISFIENITELKIIYYTIDNNKENIGINPPTKGITLEASPTCNE